MKRLTMAGAALLASTAMTQAGGIERTGFTTGILFEEGTYVELSYGSVSPDVSGNVTGVPAIASGDISPTFNTLTLGYRQDITDQLSFALVLDNPVGADVAYPAGTPYPFAGSYAELSSNQITALLRYEMANNISVYGGIRAVHVEGDVFVTTPAFSYVLNAENDYDMGYMFGAAYERPDIALRVALTYFSEVDLGLAGVEGVAPPGTPQALVPTGPTSFDGYTSVSLGAEYTQGNMSIAGGVRYIMIGDANTQLGGGATSDFSDNDAVALGLRVGFNF